MSTRRKATLDRRAVVAAFLKQRGDRGDCSSLPGWARRAST